MREVLKVRNFRMLWLGQVISSFGDSLTSLSLLILVNHLTGSTAALALMVIVMAIPQVTIGLVAGVYVDRFNRQRIMIMSDVVRGVMVLGFILVGSRETLWLLYVIGFAQATVGTFFGPARSAIIPKLVAEDQLMNANALSQTSDIFARVLGTAAAGLLIGVLDVYWPAFVIDSLTFFISALFIMRITAPSLPTQAVSGGASMVGQQLKEGLQIIVHSRILTGTLVAAGVTMLGLGAVNILLVPLIVNDLRLPETWFGLLEVAQVSSMILSAAVVGYLAAHYRPTRIVSASLIGMGSFVALIGALDAIWQLWLVLFAIGWFVTPLQASISTITQTAIPDELRGRVGAALGTLIQSANLLSMAMAGVIGDVVGIRGAFFLGGALVILAGVASAQVFGKGQGEPTHIETTAESRMANAV
ncbi:MAG: MFS transporter [Anaerolineales bacterium]|nr:MFS transporter [Anaerolineales bacterium]